MVKKIILMFVILLLLGACSSYDKDRCDEFCKSNHTSVSDTGLYVDGYSEIGCDACVKDGYKK